MNQHNLLFRYLDGEISREEDQILREQLTQDKDLNEDFQTFLEIDYNINKLNDEIDFPDDFLNEVGNNIQTKLAVDQQVRLIRKELNARYTQRFVLVPALIALFISIFVSNIENPFLNLNKVFSLNKNESSQPLISKQVNNNITTKAKHKITSTNSYATNQDLDNQSIDNQSIAGFIQSQNSTENKAITTDRMITNSHATTSSITSNIVEDVTNQNYIETLGNNLPTITSNNSDGFESRNGNENFGKSNAKTENGISNYSPTANRNNSNYNNNYNSSSNFASRNSSINYLPFDQSVNFSGGFTNIELRTIVGTDLFNFGVGKSSAVINSLTQSFASKIDDFNKFGLETGYSEFNTKVLKYIEIKNNKTSSKLLSQEDSGEAPLLTRIEDVETQFERMFWVGVFYELDYLKGENYALSSRLTLGATDVGAYSSLKLMVNYKLFKNVNITLGSDARIFNGKFNASTKNEVNSTLSLIYGLNFAF